MAHSDQPDGFAPGTASALDSLLAQSTGGMRASAGLSATCCCGRPQCAYLEHNDAALNGLEQDLQSAAQIGQALLARHETYMAEAEEERRKMGRAIDRLEGEKRELELSNAKTIEENRYLLDELEGLNNCVADADGQISSLNETLQSTMKELDRLTVLAAQTSQLEKQLLNLEQEQNILQEKVMSKEESEKSAIQRWKNAERTVNALQEQVEQIEREAKNERARHAEVVARFERRRLVEKELENAAGRLKGAAAAKGMDKEDANSSVVSSFVKDILQDNANLQMGIVELRDMLMGSNEEVEALREQMMLHQPVLPETDANADISKTESLNSELARTPTADVVPDFHVHHHYHAAAKNDSKPPVLRRPKKRRNITSPGMRTPSSGMSTPRTPGSIHAMRLTPTSSAATILAQTSVTIPPQPQLSHASHAYNWSMSQAPSSAAPSSVPSSPVFDAMSDVPDSSRPTTPGSTYLGSPQFAPRHFKRGSDVSDRSLSLNQQNLPQSISSVLHSQPGDDYDEPHFPLLDHNTIPEEPEDGSQASRPSTKDTTQDIDFNVNVPIRPTLHRASSHESLLSFRGLDIPKIRSKPSTRLLSDPRASLGTSSISSGVAITSATPATAHRSKAPRGFDSKSSYSNLLAQGPWASTSPPTPQDRPTLSMRVGALGGWITGRWGVTPASTTDMTSPTSSTFSNASTGSKDGKERAKLTATTTTAADSPEARRQPTLKTKKTLDSKQWKEEARRTQKLLGNTTADHLAPRSRAEQDTREKQALSRADNRLSTHIEPVHLNDSLLQESLSEVTSPERQASASAEPMQAVASPVGEEKLSLRCKKEVRPLSTHVEAVSVDGAGLAEALGGL